MLQPQEPKALSTGDAALAPLIPQYSFDLLCARQGPTTNHSASIRPNHHQAPLPRTPCQTTRTWLPCQPWV